MNHGMILTNLTNMLTATHISYLQICHRKLWLFASGIQMESGSELVEQGKFIGETTYPEKSQKFKEIAIGGSKIDRYAPKEGILHEVKKSNKMEESHIAQVKYYMYLLKEANLKITKAVIDYPKMRQTKTIEMSELDISEIENWIADANDIIREADCPPTINKKFCKNCSYFEFCYSGEE